MTSGMTTSACFCCVSACVCIFHEPVVYIHRNNYTQIRQPSMTVKLKLLYRGCRLFGGSKRSQVSFLTKEFEY